MLAYDTHHRVSSRELLVRSYLRADPSFRERDDEALDEAVIRALWGQLQPPVGHSIKAAVERSRRPADPASVARAPIGTGFSELRKAMGFIFGVTYMPAVLTFAAWTGTTVSFPMATNPLLPTRPLYVEHASGSKGLPFVLSEKTLRDIVNLPAQSTAPKSALEVRRAPIRHVQSDVVEVSAFTEQANSHGKAAILVPSRTWEGMYRDSVPEVSGTGGIDVRPQYLVPAAPINVRIGRSL